MSETKTTKASIDDSDPFVLHHSDHQGMMLVSKPLEGYNYGPYSHAMRISLSAKNKIGFVNGSIKAPMSSYPKFHIWQRCNDMVLSWILNAIHPDLAGSVIYAEMTTEVWEDLKERFSQGNDSRIFQIQQEIVEHRQRHQSVSIYYTKLKALWDELASYHEPPCYTCEGLKALVERQEKERVMQFFMGLNESYATICRVIFMMRPFPDTRKAHTLVLQQERQANVAAKRDISASHHAMHLSSVTQAHRSSALLESRTPKRLLKCNHYDLDGYLLDLCFYLHGLPVGHKLHGKNVKPKGKRPTAHNTQTNDVKTPKAPTTVAATFTIKEYNQFMALLRKGNGNEQSFANITRTPAPTYNSTQHDPLSTLYWIVDSDAIDHMSKFPSTHNTSNNHCDFVHLSND
ncbi:hypothetical protein ACH5RR_018842 [Cinchona calisaya]|uniref:Retrotransposon Copia-like N-terminal domain-containing protein n=1 Tax=Cinchona calisaya TaxID=153742 RepID=A0ABD2ZN43_9GENT